MVGVSKTQTQLEAPPVLHVALDHHWEVGGKSADCVQNFLPVQVFVCCFGFETGFPSVPQAENLPFPCLSLLNALPQY